MVASSAQATNGYFLPGFGATSMGMGGVGIGFGIDSISAAANPANLAKSGKRADLDLMAFSPLRSVHVYDDPASPVQNPFFGTRLGEVNSGRNLFPMPNLGFSMPVTPDVFFGVAFVSNGGMNTSYPRNFFSVGSGTLNVPQNPGNDTYIGVDLAQLLVPISVAFKPIASQSLGASLTLAAQRFSARGLGAFKAFNISADSDHLTDNGYDFSYGLGLRLGWQGDFLDDKLTVGATWASKTYMTRFNRYRGLFAEQGSFDIPSNFGLGLAVHPTKDLTIALDVMKILYSDVRAIANRGPDKVSIQALSPGPCPADPNCLGNNDGMGFGWTDQTVYKLGINYRVNNALAVRAGYNYGKSPIPDDQLAFNTLAPATVESHYTAGLTYKANKNLEIGGIYMYVPEHKQQACGLQLVDCVSFRMSQQVVGVNFSWVWDPGKYD